MSPAQLICFIWFWLSLFFCAPALSYPHCCSDLCAISRETKLCQFSSVQSLSRVWLFETPWTAACQASLPITNSWSLLKLMSITLVMPSNHLILCQSLHFQSFPASRSFWMNQFFASGGQSIGVSASAPSYIYTAKESPNPQIIFFYHFSSQWFSIHSRIVFKNLWYSQIISFLISLPFWTDLCSNWFCNFFHFLFTHYFSLLIIYLILIILKSVTQVLFLWEFSLKIIFIYFASRLINLCLHRLFSTSIDSLILVQSLENYSY